jgi:hypothetical protein
MTPLAALPSSVRAKSCYALPREAVVNLLRLPAMGCQRGEQILRFTYFQDELRVVPIALADSPLPLSMPRTAGGMAILGMAGTLLEVRASDEAEERRVQQFLDDKLQPYELEKE